MKFARLPGRFFGLSAHNAAEVAHRAAFGEAVAVCSFSSAEYFPNEQIITEAQRQFLSHVASFAINARRALEILDVRDLTIKGGRWKMATDVEDFNLESNLWNALNKIVHARHLQVFVFQKDSKLIENVGYEWRLSFLEVQSDRGKKIHVDPFGMAFAYLDEMSSHFPTL